MGQGISDFHSVDLWYLARKSNFTQDEIRLGVRSSSRQLADCAGIVAPQNLHFTGFLFWSEETT